MICILEYWNVGVPQRMMARGLVDCGVVLDWRLI